MNVESLLSFKSLEEAQAHSITNQHMISNKTMALYLKQFGLYLVLDNIAKGEDHPAKETCLLIMNTLLGGSADNRDFNFIQGDVKGEAVIENTTQLKVDIPEHKEAIEALLNQCISHCNSVEYPYSKATQEQWDEAQLMADVPKIESSYPSGEFIVALSKDKYALQITIDEPLEFADKLTITASSKNLVDGAVFADNFAVRGTVSIPANYAGTVSTNPINLSGLSRHIKLFAQSKYTRNFTVNAVSVL